MRFFNNPYSDYDMRQEVVVDSDLWNKRVDEVASDILSHGQQVERPFDGGLYVGPVGVAFALWRLAKCKNGDEASKYLQRAQKWVELNLMYVNKPDIQKDKQMKMGFLLGASGVYAVAAAVAQKTNNPENTRELANKFAGLADTCLPVQLHDCGSDELFVGRAGYISGALWLQSVLGQEIVPQRLLHDICDSTVESGRNYAKNRKGNQRTPPLMYAYHGTEYLGAGHGLCSILQMLLSVPGYFQHNSTAEKDIKDSTDFLIGLQTPTGNLPCAMDEAQPFKSRAETDDLVHWCHGAPGTVYLFARAYLVWKESQYLEAALKCGECVWQRGLLKKGPGICHGVAGSGYVFLILYRLTQDKKHLYRALMFAEFLYTDTFKSARTPDCPYSLYEGTAGTLCFLLDLLKPTEAAFPFSDVFVN